MFSITPPRHVLVLMRITRSRLGLSILLFSANTLRHPPEISLPITTPPWPFCISQLRTMMFWLGRSHRRPSLLRPLFMAMQSSPVLKKQFSMSTPSHDSGSQPSPLGPSLLMCTPRTVMFFESSGWITQNGERSRVTFSMSMPSHWLKFISCGRRPSSGPKRRSSIGTPSSAIFSRRARLPLRWLMVPSFQP